MILTLELRHMNGMECWKVRNGQLLKDHGGRKMGGGFPVSPRGDLTEQWDVLLLRAPSKGPLNWGIFSLMTQSCGRRKALGIWPSYRYILHCFNAAHYLYSNPLWLQRIGNTPSTQQLPDMLCQHLVMVDFPGWVPVNLTLTSWKTAIHFRGI